MSAKQHRFLSSGCIEEKPRGLKMDTERAETDYVVDVVHTNNLTPVHSTGESSDHQAGKDVYNLCLYKKSLSAAEINVDSSHRQMFLGATKSHFESNQRASKNNAPSVLSKQLSHSDNNVFLNLHLKSEAFLKHKKERNLVFDQNILVSEKKYKKLKKFIYDHIDKYQELAYLLSQDKFFLVKSLVPIIKQKDISSVSEQILELFILFDKDLDFVRTIIECEVQSSSVKSILFRNNTFFTSVLSNYCRRVGNSSLKEVLAPSVQWLLESEHDYDISSDDLPSEKLRQNQYNLRYLINKFFKSITNEKSPLMNEIHDICIILYSAISQKFSDFDYTIISGFLFLRFICPALMNPQKYQLTEAPLTPRCQRAMILVAKSLQQIANNQSFSESHMQFLNVSINKLSAQFCEFIDKKVIGDKKNLLTFSERLAPSKQTADEIRRSKKLANTNYAYIISLHWLLLYNNDYIVTYCVGQEDGLTHNLGFKVAQILDQMGIPPAFEGCGRK